LRNKILRGFVFAIFLAFGIILILSSLFPKEERQNLELEKRVEEVECKILGPKEIMIRDKISGEILRRVNLTLGKFFSSATSAEVREKGAGKEIVIKTEPCLWLIITAVLVWCPMSLGVSYLFIKL